MQVLHSVLIPLVSFLLSFLSGIWLCVVCHLLPHQLRVISARQTLLVHHVFDLLWQWPKGNEHAVAVIHLLSSLIFCIYSPMFIHLQHLLISCIKSNLHTPPEFTHLLYSLNSCIHSSSAITQHMFNHFKNSLTSYIHSPVFTHQLFTHQTFTPIIHSSAVIHPMHSLTYLQEPTIFTYLLSQLVTVISALLILSFVC